MLRLALMWSFAFFTGLSLGYLLWGEASRRADDALARDLSVAVGEVRGQSQLLREMLNEDARETGAALEVCEAAQARMQQQLEKCLFAKAEENRHVDPPEQGGSPRRGTASVVEEFSYPIPLPPPANR